MSDNVEQIKENKENDENKENKENNQSIIVKYGIIPNILMKLGYKHIKADKDGLYNGLILPKQYSKYLFWTSFFTLGSGLFVLHKKQYYSACYPLSIFITSANYWRHPENNWRRYLDQMVVRLCMIIHTLKVTNFVNFYPHLIIAFFSVSCYPLSYFYQDKYLPMTILLHALLHIGGNLANIVLYSETNFNNIIV